MRSKLPSMVGVYSRPRMPPARFMGPVCIPLMPISRKMRPELRVAQAAQHRLARPGDVRGRVGGEPDRGQRRGGARLRIGVGVLPELPLARIAPRRQLCLAEHGALHQPADIGVAGGGSRCRCRRRHRGGRGGPGGSGSGGAGRRRLARQPERTEERGQGQKDEAEPDRLRGRDGHRRARNPKQSRQWARIAPPGLEIDSVARGARSPSPPPSDAGSAGVERIRVGGGALVEFVQDGAPEHPGRPRVLLPLDRVEVTGRSQRGSPGLPSHSPIRVATCVSYMVMFLPPICIQIVPR